MMTEFWLISAPGEKTCQQTFETMNNVTNKQNLLSENYKFQIPDLKVGTLDQLVGLSDDLGKLDAFVEQVTRKVATYLGEVLEDQRDKLHENLTANNNDDNNNGGDETDVRTSSSSSSSSRGRNLSPPKMVGHEHYARRCSCSMEHSPTLGMRSRTAARGNASHYSECSGASATSSSPISCCSGGGLGSPPPSSSSGLNRSRSWSYTRAIRHRHRKKSSVTDDDDDVDVEAGSRDHAAAGDDAVQSNDDGSIRTHDYFSSEQCSIAPADLQTYLTRFQWDMAKYPIKQSLRNIADIISKQVGQIDADLKTKSTAYNNLKGSLQNLEKKQTGSLLTRNLADLVKREHFILDSEYLTTLLVIVPKANYNEWQMTYEKLTDMIVPRSTTMIYQDSEYGLFTVTLFKKVVEEFKLHAREKKFIVREFTYNEEELAAGKNEITKLVTDKKKQFGPLVRWLKVNFSECFCAWVHVKALRVFVESVLRYGLPVNFQAILIQPHRKATKKLRDALNQLYGHLDSSALQSSGHHDNVDIPGLGFGQAEYYPYVYYKLEIDMVD